MDNYLKGIKESNRQVIEEIYNKFFPILRNFVVKNSGTEEDARDCFQDALIATYKRLQREDFEIKNTFSTYIFSVGKFIWFKKAKQNIKTEAIADFKMGEVDLLEEDLLSGVKYSLFKKGLDSLGEDCQKILEYYFDGKKYKEIAALMNYTIDYARRKKMLCTKSLIQIVKSDPLYKDCYD